MTLYEDVAKLYSETKHEIAKIEREIAKLEAKKEALEGKRIDLDIILTRYGTHCYEKFLEAKESEDI